MIDSHSGSSTTNPTTTFSEHTDNRPLDESDDPRAVVDDDHGTGDNDDGERCHLEQTDSYEERYAYYECTHDIDDTILIEDGHGT